MQITNVPKFRRLKTDCVFELPQVITNKDTYRLYN